MNKILRILILATAFSFPVGLIGSISIFPGVNIYFHDAVLLITMGYILREWGIFKNTVAGDRLLKAYYVFLAVCLLSNILSPVDMDATDRMVSLLYIFRLFLYSFAYFPVRILFQRGMIGVGQIYKILAADIILLCTIGWVQYFLYPDLRNLEYLGWDPHYMRIFSTFFDPNFLGMIIVFAIILISGMRNRVISTAGTVFLLLTLAFTYSRSSYLALFVATVYRSVISNNSRKILLVMIPFATVILLLPRPFGNESVKLERLFTLTERMNNWKKTVEIFQNHPVLGIGFNTMRYFNDTDVQTQDKQINHAGAGADNSILFLMATTGLIGLMTYIRYIMIAYSMPNNLLKISLVALSVHSMFVNSLFFPFTVIWLWLLSASNGFREHKFSPRHK